MSFTSIGQTGRTLAGKNPVTAGGQPGKGTSVATPLSTSEIATWLGKQRPADMDKAAVSRASSHGVTLRVKFEQRYPSGPNGERMPSYQVAVGCDLHGTVEQCDAAAQDLRNFMAPASSRQIEAWIAELSVITAKRADDAFSEELRITAYANRLIRYPADVARSVLLESSYKFFPTWEELEKRCESLTSPRRNMIAALERGPAAPEPQYRPATQQERDRVQSLVDELFPMRSAEMRKSAVDEAMKGNCMKADEPTPKRMDAAE